MPSLSFRKRALMFSDRIMMKTHCYKHLRQVLFSVGAGAVLSACADTPSPSTMADAKLPVKTILQSSHCPVYKHTVKVIESEEELEALQKPSPATQIGKQAPQSSAQEQKVDFSQNKVILIALGTRPNLGYGLELTDAQAGFKQGELSLPVRIHEPEPGRFYAQVITSPCLVLSIPLVEEVSRIHLTKPEE